MISEIKKNAEEGMTKAVNSLVNELKKVRTGKAQVSMLDLVKVNYYGTPTQLSQVASVSCPDAKSFLIAPWESSVLKDIEAGIIKSNLGMSPQNDGKVIRLKLPELTEQRRKELVKSLKKTVEEGRIAVRMARRDANEEIKKLLKAKEISEDEQKKSSEEIQKLTDKYIKNVDEVSSSKEKELLTI